eukprot:TRINITY_DN15078_c0_g1_i1.p1 TRINITY_DN15078_c0_g1~~TRINITY_DN15078_c0_g1_i1.p1  ORF type:complete len:106 (-),score=16.85 TRINITY_DN15078_c0_g1_i1:399-716(-)
MCIRDRYGETLSVHHPTPHLSATIGYQMLMPCFLSGGMLVASDGRKFTLNPVGRLKAKRHERFLHLLAAPTQTAWPKETSPAMYLSRDRGRMVEIPQILVGADDA